MSGSGGSSDDLAGTAVVSHDGAAGRGPGEYAAVEVVDLVVAALPQVCDHLGGPRADPADHHHVTVGRDLVGTPRDLHHRDVVRARRMAGRPLVGLAHVEQVGVVGDL